jgi:hypothetical protein
VGKAVVIYRNAPRSSTPDPVVGSKGEQTYGQEVIIEGPA